VIVAIHQPNYIPWLGYFYKISRADVFVLLDNVQFPKESPAARNFIKGKDGHKVLLSASVKKSKGTFQNYNELELDYTNKWHIKHLNHIKDAYIKASFFKTYFPEFEAILKEPSANLAELNIKIIKWITNHLELKTRIEISSQFDDGSLGTKNDRNLNICMYFGAKGYLSGNGAKKYNDELIYKEKQIELIYSDYISKEYKQINGEFAPNLSILDVLFNIGAEETKKLIN
jgi:hypothetical protein